MMIMGVRHMRCVPAAVLNMAFTILVKVYLLMITEEDGLQMAENGSMNLIGRSAGQ